MKKNYFLLIILSVIPFFGFSQFINGNTDFAAGLFLSTCANHDTLFDSGGEFASYTDGQNMVMTICPDVTSMYVEVLLNQLGDDDELCFYDGGNTSAPLLMCLTGSDYTIPLEGTTVQDNFQGFTVQTTVDNTLNGCITIEFTSDASDGEVGDFELVLDCGVQCQTILANPTFSPDTAYDPIGEDFYIDICIGQDLILTGSALYPQSLPNPVGTYTQSDAQSTFTWDFQNGDVLQGQSLTYSYAESGGFFINLIVEDQFGCLSQPFLTKVRVAPDPEFILGDTVLCKDDTLNLSGGVEGINVNGGVIQGETQFFIPPFFSGDSIQLPDSGNDAIYSTVQTLSGFGPTDVIQDCGDIMSICLNIEHSYTGDLDISIECPNGSIATLMDFPNNGGGTYLGDALDDGTSTPGTGYTYCFNVNGTDNLDNGPTIPSSGFGGSFAPGDYLPEDAFTTLVGCPLNGDWTLNIQDNLAIDNGTLFNWELQIDGCMYPDIDSFEVFYSNGAWEDNQPTLYYNVGDSIGLTSDITQDEIYVYSIENQFGCVYYDTIEVSYFGFDIDLTPADTSLCAGDEVQLNVTTSIPVAPDCGASPVSCAATNTVDVGNPSGTGTATNSPFYWFYDDIRLQILYTAADLNAMGFTGGIIDAIAFDITAKNSNIPFENYTVKMACTDLTAIGNDFESAAFVDVVTLATYNTQLGWSELPFTTPYVWDGVSNLIIELCNDNFNGSWIPGDSDAVRVTNNVGYQAVAFNRADNSDGCSLTNAGFGFNVSTNRPNIRFSYCDANPDVVWTPSMDLSDSTSLNPIATPMVDTDYIATITDGHGCSYSDTASIDVASDFAYTLTPNTSVCEGGSIQLSATGADTYVWTPDDGTLDDNMISDPTATPVDNTLYYIELTLDGCSTTDSVEVLVNPIPQAEINNGNTQETICDGASVLLFTADNPGWSYSWTGPQTGMGASLQATMAGTYNLVFSDGTCFGMPQSIDVISNAIPQLDFTDLRTILCCNDEVIFNAANFADIGIDEIIWDGSPQDLQDVMIFSGDQGVHTISVLSNGCESVEVNLMFENKCIEGISINHPAEVFANAPTEVTASYSFGNPSNLTYDWTAASLFDGSTDSVAIFTAGEGVYDVMVALTEDFTLNNGESFSCTETADGQITVIYVGDPDIANAFSPNGDDLNDFFRPLNVDGHSTVKNFRVYNRWGELMYEHDGLDQGWDGMFKGELQPQGVYTYYIEVEKPGSEVFFEQGIFTLLK